MPKIRTTYPNVFLRVIYPPLPKATTIAQTSPIPTTYLTKLVGDGKGLGCVAELGICGRGGPTVVAILDGKIAHGLDGTARRLAALKGELGQLIDGEKLIAAL